MTAISLRRPLLFPAFFQAIENNPATATDVTLDAAGEYVAYAFQATQDMTISHVVWRNGAATGSPTAEIRIETLAADGTPSGTLWAANTNVTTGTLIANTTNLSALTASASITRGQFFAVMIKYASGTSFVVQLMTRINISTSQVPWKITNVSGAAAKSAMSYLPIIGFGSGAATFYPLSRGLPTSIYTANAFNNTNSAAQGLRFKVPMDCRLIGARIFHSTQVGDYNLVCYDDAGTELSSSSTAIDGNYGAESATAFYDRYFDNVVNLSKDTWYRVAVEPSSTTNSQISTLTFDSADYLGASPWPGANGHYTARASGTWTDTATDQLPLIELLLDQVDDGAGAGGGGGLLAHPGMRGGFV